MPLSAGSIVDGRFRVAELLGEGGMGNIYRAEQFGLSRQVALKQMHASLEKNVEHRKRFMREAQVLSTMKHSGIVQFLHFGVVDDHPYLVMELCSGKSLRSLLNDMGRIPWERAVNIAIQTVEALCYAHEHNVVHRDLTPQNILIEEAGLDDRVRIIDFGLAVLLGSSKETLTQTGSLVGSVRYMSPEQSRGHRAEPKSDTYAMGCILYEMLSGEPPFDADTSIGLLFKHQHDAPPRLTAPQIPADARAIFESLVGWCMAKTASARPSDQELLSVLRSIIAMNWSAASESLKSANCEESSSKLANRTRYSLVTAVSVVLLIGGAISGKFLLTTDSGISLSGQRLTDFGMTDDEMKFRTLEQTLRMIDQDRMSYSVAKRLLGMWSCSHPVTEGNAIQRSDEALALAHKYSENGKHLLAALAWSLNLDACLKKRTPELREIRANLSALRRSLIFPEARPAIAELLDLEAEHFRLDDHTVRQLQTRLAIEKVSLAIVLRKPSLASRYLLRLLNGKKLQFEENEINEMCDQTGQVIEDLDRANEKSELNELLHSLSPLLRLSGKSHSLTGSQLALLGVIFQKMQGSDRVQLAQSYWMLVPTSQKLRLEYQSLSLTTLFQFFLVRQEFARARDYAIRVGRDREKAHRETEALAFYRLALEAQDSAKQSGRPISAIPQDVYKSLQRLYLSEKVTFADLGLLPSLRATTTQMARLHESRRIEEIIKGLIRSKTFLRLSKSEQEELLKLQAESKEPGYGGYYP